LSIAAQSANAIVFYARVAYVCALRVNAAAERVASIALGHCDTGKTTHPTKSRNREENFDHVTTSLLNVFT
jgi:hypothetical protein